MAIVACALLAAARADAQFQVADPVPGEQYVVELGLYWWTPTPVLDIQTGALAAVGENRVDFVQEFGIENRRFTEFRATLKAGRKHKLRFSRVPMRYDESATLTRTIDFGGATFPVSVPATADLEWLLWRVGYEWDFASTDRGFVGLVTEIKINQVTAELAAENLGSELTEITAPVPTIGIVARGYPGRHVSITGEFTGFSVPGFVGNWVSKAVGDDFEAKMFDFDIYATVNLGRNVGIQGGYRSVTADYTVDDDAGDLEMKGPYFGGLVRF
jgi:hypothetical protein